MGDFAEIRGRRPEPQPPREEVIARAKENLMRAIEEEKTTRPGATEMPEATSAVVDLDQRRRRTHRVMAGVGAACVAVAAVAFVAGHDDPSTPGHTQIVASGPQIVLRNAATSVATGIYPTGTGPTRHLRFTNLTDAGHPTYDAYVRPDGTALVGTAGSDLHETSGYLTSAQLSSLPSDPYRLRTEMLSLSEQLGLGYPGENPNRALYRLATELLPDPEVTPAVKAGIYRALAGLDLESIRARDLGTGTDQTGRPGNILEFSFEEGYTDRLVIDSRTGALLSVETTDREGKLTGGQVYLDAQMVDTMHQAPA